jgi:TPR repeat protein
MLYLKHTRPGPSPSIPRDPGALEEAMDQAEFERELAHAERGSGVSQAFLGQALLYGIGVPVDHELAFRLLTMGHAQGVLIATVNLARMYKNGWAVRRDPARAVELYEDVASRGDWLSLIELARMFRLGEGVAPDPHRAGDYYARAVDAVDAEDDVSDSDEWKEAVAYLSDHGRPEDR